MDFLCLDVETANESAASNCQIGIATFIVGEGRRAYPAMFTFFLNILVRRQEPDRK
jgi:hypothetical protein